MIDPEVAARLRNNRDFAALESHIQEHMARLASVLNIDRAKGNVAETTIGKQLAHATLQEILQPLLDAQDLPDMTQAAREKREDTGLL